MLRLGGSRFYVASAYGESRTPTGRLLRPLTLPLVYIRLAQGGPGYSPTKSAVLLPILPEVFPAGVAPAISALGKRCLVYWATETQYLHLELHQALKLRRPVLYLLSYGGSKLNGLTG